MRAEDRHAGKPRHPRRETHHPFQKRTECRLTSFGLMLAWFSEVPDHEGGALDCGAFADESVCRDAARLASPFRCRALRLPLPFPLPCARAPLSQGQVGAYLRDVACFVPPPHCLRSVALAPGVSLCPV